jgi:hypothetical protein
MCKRGSVFLKDRGSLAILAGFYVVIGVDPKESDIVTASAIRMGWAW